MPSSASLSLASADSRAIPATWRTRSMVVTIVATVCALNPCSGPFAFASQPGEGTGPSPGFSVTTGMSACSTRKKADNDVVRWRGPRFLRAKSEVASAGHQVRMPSLRYLSL